MIGGCKGAEPGYGERMAEHHLHVHPFGLLGPPSLLLLKLLDALRGQDGINPGKMQVSTQIHVQTRYTAGHVQELRVLNAYKKMLQVLHSSV